MRVSVYGAGKLGLPLALVLSEVCDQVILVDLSHIRVADINERSVETPEPHVQELLASTNHAKLVATTDSTLAALMTDISFILVPTPSGDDDRFDAIQVVNCCKAIGHAAKLKPLGFPHTVVVVSTVQPGTLRVQLLPVLEEWAACPHGDRFELLYGPEFVALGNVVDGMRSPDAYLVGAERKEDVANLMLLYNRVSPGVPLHIMSWEEAEWAKLLLNCYLSTKAAYASMVHRILGEGARKVLGFLGEDHRIGPAFLKPGPPPGGPCLPRDLRSAMTEDHTSFIASASAVLEADYQDILNEAIAWGHSGGVGILGMSYKEGFPLLEESLGSRLVADLQEREIDVYFYDVPEVDVDAHNTSLEGVLDMSAVVILALPRPEFIAAAEGHDPDQLWIDPWGVLE